MFQSKPGDGTGVKSIQFVSSPNKRLDGSWTKQRGLIFKPANGKEASQPQVIKVGAYLVSHAPGSAHLDTFGRKESLSEGSDKVAAFVTNDLGSTAPEANGGKFVAYSSSDDGLTWHGPTTLSNGGTSVPGLYALSNNEFLAAWVATDTNPPAAKSLVGQRFSVTVPP